MSDYTITTDFGAKDSLPSGNAAKIIKGSEFTTEFTNIKTAVNTKADTTGDTFTGAVTFDAAVTNNAAVTINSTATITGDLTVDTNTLFVDVSENRVGIGTTSFPSTEAILTLSGTGASTAMYFGGGSDYNFIRSIREANNVHHMTFGYKYSDGSDVERMRIDSSGNVGIGTDSPDQKLDINNGNLRLETTNSQYVFASDTNAVKAGHRYHVGDNYVATYTASTERMRIDSSGNVGIGTTSPDTQLHVHGAGSGNGTYGAQITIGKNNGCKISSTQESTDDDVQGLAFFTKSSGAFANPAIERLRINSLGNVGIGTTSPTKTLHISDGANNTPTTFRIENTDTAIETDQEVNSIEFYTNDSSTSGTGVTAKIAQVAENPGNQYGLAFSTYDAGLEEAMRIDESGKVGIGTTSPAELLHVTGASTAKIQITSTSATGISGVHFGDPDDVNVGRVQYEHATNHMALHTSDTERMRIDSSGNVLVGTTTTDIAQATTETGIVLNNGGWYEGSRDGGTVGYFNRLSNNGEILSFRKDGTTVGSISVTGSATSYNTSSDERLKENIADSADAGSKVDAIQIRQFDWKADGLHQDYGVIAQELLEVAPEAVSEGDTEEDMMGVDYSKLVPMLIKEVQTLRNRVAQLENN